MATSTFNHSSLHALNIAFCNVIRILWYKKTKFGKKKALNYLVRIDI